MSYKDRLKKPKKKIQAQLRKRKITTNCKNKRNMIEISPKGGKVSEMPPPSVPMMNNINKADDFGKAYDNFSDSIFRHCYFKVRNRELARDITQEAFMRTWKYINNGGEVRNMSTFLYKVANNIILDKWRKKKELSLDLLREKGFEPAGNDDINIKKDIETKEVLKLLDRIHTTYREVIIMRYVDGLSLKEIAQILNQAENNISVRIHRGVQQIQKILNEQDKKNI